MKHFFFLTNIVLVLCLFSCEENQTSTEDTTISNDGNVMLLGVYHFDNPGQDKINYEIDDYLTEKRQEEIAEVVAKINQFQPTKILIEKMPKYESYYDSLYQLFRKDELNLADLEAGRNEVFQLGFNVGKDNNIQNINCIDADGIYLGYYLDWVADTLEFEAYNDYENQQISSADSTQNYYENHTILENLQKNNEPEHIAELHNSYNHIGLMINDKEQKLGYHYVEKVDSIDGEEYYLQSFDFENIGVEYTALWYKRNIHIYKNALEQISKDDKVLIIYGASHIHILQQMFEDHPDFQVANTMNFLQ